MNILDLFCGTKSWSKPFEGKAEITSVDIDYRFNPTLLRNILEWDYTKEIMPYPDIIFASPPCGLYFTSIKNNSGVRVITEGNFIMSKRLVDKTIEILQYFNPKFWLVENPKGKMRYMYPFILHKMFKTFDYCMYGLPYKKPTDIWTNIELEPRRCNHKKHKQAIRAHSWSEESYYHRTDLRREVHRAIIAPRLVKEISEKVLIASLHQAHNPPASR